MANYYVDLDGNISKKKKKKKQNSRTAYTVDFDGNISEVKEEPVKKTVTTSKDKEEKEGYFSSGTFDKDKYDRLSFTDKIYEGVLDTVSSVSATVADVGVGVVKGAFSSVEGVKDLVQYGVAGVGDLLGADKFAEDWRKEAQKSDADALFGGIQDYIAPSSLLGTKGRAVPEALGNMATILLTGGLGASAGLGKAGVTALTTSVTGASSMGSGMSEAYNEGASDLEATTYGAIKGVADAGTELIFAGLGKSVNAVGFNTGLSNADDMLAKKVSEKISNQVAKNFVEYGIKAGAEGSEEVLAGVVSAIGKKVTYMEEEELSQLLKDENLLDQFIVGAVTSGIAQSGYVPYMTDGSLREANKTGRDFITGLTQNEQKVIDSVVNSRVSEAETDGKKLTNKEKGKIQEEVRTELEKGYIDIDTIESTLGGETYNQYKTMTDEETLLQDKIKSLENTKSIKERKQLVEAREQLEALQKDSDRTQRKTQLEEQLHTEVDKMTANDTFLRESYNERTRRGQKFEADVEQYTGKGKEIVQRAIDSGKVNNTRRSRDFVDFLAKTSTGNSIDFDFTNVSELQKLGLAVEGKTSDGYVDGETIGLNIQSNKALNKAVGHDIVRLLEGNEDFQAIQDEIKAYADKKGDYKALYDFLNTQYRDMKSDTDATEHEAKIQKEVTANLLGNYIFTDSNFVNEFAVKNPKTFKSVYEEIKKLLKNTNSGSKEEKALKEVKKMFDNANSQEVKAENIDKNDVLRDNNSNITDGNRGESYARTDEFRRLQEESQRMSDEEWNFYLRGGKNETVRGRISTVLKGQMDAWRSSGGSNNGVLTLTARGNDFNIYENVDGSLFHDVFEVARKYLKNGELVDLHGIETTEDGIGYNDTYNYLSEDGLSGFSITPDGDLISVFNASDKNGFLRAISDIVKTKAKTLDCFASQEQNLMEMYSNVFGFKTASVMDYNMEYDHDNIAQNHSNPEVAFMVNTDADVETKHFTKDQYDEALDYRNSFVDKTTDRKRIINKLTGEEIDTKTYDVLDRLSKGEEVSVEEVESLKEIQEGIIKTEELLDDFIAKNNISPDIDRKDVGTYLLNTVERAELRDSIIKKRLKEGSFTGVDKNGNEVYNGDVKKGKRLDIVIGLPASGKSSSIVNPLSQYYQSAVIDSDIIKKMLPEFNDGWGGTLVHEEPSLINSYLLDDIMDTGSNVVLPIVGSKVSSVEKYIDLAKSKGYEINVHLNELSNSKAIGRMIGRYFSDGRFINPSYAMAYGDKPTAVFEEIKQRSDIDGYSKWNNDVERGQRPKLEEISDNNRPYGVYNGTYGQISGDAIGQTDSQTASEESNSTNQIAPTKTPDNGVFFDAPMTEQQANERDAMQSDRISTLDEADMPAEVEAPIYEPTEVKNPFDERDIKDVGNRQVKAYMYENPEVKPYFQEEAQVMLGELQRSVKGEKHFNDQLYYDTNGENGWFGTKRETSEEIAYLLDNFKYTYTDIEKGLKAIIEDNGKENNAISKRIEFMLDERLRDGHTDFETGMEIPANEDYINLLTDKQITEYSDEAYNQWVKSLSDTFMNEDPFEDIAPTRQFEAIEPKPKENPDYTEQEQEWANNKMTRADRPRKNDGKTQRRWVETSTESEVVNREILPDDLDQSAIYYEPISNKTTLTKANNKLDILGYDKALKNFMEDINNKNVSLEDVVLGERLLQEALKKGDTKTAGELIQNIAILGTELGQKVQALSIIQRMTPEGQLKMLQKTVNRGKVKGDKAYSDVEITQEMIDEILKTYNKDGSFDQDKLNDAVESVKKKIADQMKVTAGEKINAWRYLAMLGNPKTHIRNLVSNLAMQFTMKAKNAVARTFETIAPIKDRTKTWKTASEDVKKYAKQTTAEMKEVLTSENGYSEDASIKAKRDIFKNKILQKVYGFNNDLLTKEDWWFKKSAFRNAFQEYLTANGIRTQEDITNNPELVEKAKNYAMEQAQISTFQQYSLFANKISEFERMNTWTQIGVGAVMPFKKTPINIAKTGLSYSPLGFTKALTYDLYQMKQGKMEASQVVDNLAKGVTGSALVYIGYMLAMSGLLNGGGEDDKESKYDYQLGEQSYSLSIDGKTYSLNWLSPVAIPLFVGANAYEMLEEDKELTIGDTSEALIQTLNPLSEMSFLSGLDSALSSYESGMGKFAGIGETIIQNYVTQFIPTLSSQVATVLDDTKRDTKVSANSEAKLFEQTLNKLKYKIPFLRETLEPSTDIWGNEVSQTEDTLTRAFETFIAPYSRKDSIATEIDKEIKDLYSKTGDDGLIPTIPKNTVKYDGETYKMSAKEYTAYKKTYGQTANDLLEDLFKTTSYKNADADSKAEMVENVYDYARDTAKLEYLDKEGVAYTNTTEDNIPVYKENKIKGAIENDMTLDEFDLFNKSKGKYYISKAIGGFEAYDSYNNVMNDIEGDKDKNGNTINGSKKAYVENYINGLPLDYGRKILLFTSKYPKDDTYKADVLEYLKSRTDITYAEMVEILTELNYEVYQDGTVRW